MGREENCKKIQEALQAFQFEGKVSGCESYGSGHINDTFLVQCRLPDDSIKRYILQRMNHEIFKQPEELMENIINVTSYLRTKIIENNGDPDRETLNVVPTISGAFFFKDSIGSYWRVYKFIEDSVSYDAVEKVEDFYQSAVAFGNFQRLLSEFPAEKLHETIVGFHDTGARFEVFKKAVEDDVMGRAAEVKEEIAFVMERESLAYELGNMLKQGKLPLRVTHNDTKLNNIMMDKKSGKGICVIDLDTVMPGLAIHDFGDSIRFGANTGAEDEIDLEKVSLDLELFELYTKGFIEGCAGSLTDIEIKMMPMGAKSMTFECGMRFLTDYLSGDTYFKIHREKHNLDRCRTQFKLVHDMEEKWSLMEEIVDRCHRTI